MHNGYKRIVTVMHRRAGKDKTCINIVASQSQKRVGSYYYVYPTYSQGKKAIWNGMDKEGFPFLGHFPKEIRAGINNQEMIMKLKGGSLFQMIGSSNIDSVVGSNPVGIVFSEYSLQSPQGWEFLKPILEENDGWAVFNYTPRGQNHGYDLFTMANNNPNWFCQKLTIDDTGVLNKEDMDRLRAEGDSEEHIQQEYYCSFEAAVPGAYYSSELRLARDEHRICKVPHHKDVLVHLAWDIGSSHSTVIWFWQEIANELHFIDYLEGQGEGLDFYVKELIKRKDLCGYRYGEFYAPHDFFAKTFAGGGMSMSERAKNKHNIDSYRVPNIAIDDGIEAARNIFPRCYFDEIKCKQGIAALMAYHKAWNDKNRVFSLRPVQDWSTDAADSFRYAAIGITNTQGFVMKNKLDNCAVERSW